MFPTPHPQQYLGCVCMIITIPNFLHRFGEFELGPPCLCNQRTSLLSFPSSHSEDSDQCLSEKSCSIRDHPWPGLARPLVMPSHQSLGHFSPSVQHRNSEQQLRSPYPLTPCNPRTRSPYKSPTARPLPFCKWLGGNSSLIIKF